jgi:hypothetical protein
MSPRTFLHIEGLAVFLAALAVYVSLGGPLWLLAVLALAPDLSMAGYLAGPAVGSRVYTLFYTYTVPLAAAGLGVWTGTTLALPVATVWAAHIGADRLVGYGLKLRGRVHAHPPLGSYPDRLCPESPATVD